MKNTKQTIVLFIGGLLLGALILGAGIWLGYSIGAKAPETGGQAVTAEESPEKSEDGETEDGKVSEGSSRPENDRPLPENKETEESKQPEDAETAGKGDPEESDVQAGDGKDKEDAGQQTTNTVEDTWSPDTIYTGGEEVVFNGKIYKAKWWTQGDQPGTSDVWEDTLIAAGETIDQMVEDEPEQNDEPRDEVEKREDFKVVGYFPSWKDKTDKIQYDVLTHINYAFAIPTAEGGLLPLENADMAQKIIKKAHENDVKVFIAIGGWSYHEVPLESTFVSATETKEKREAFVNAIMDMCNEYGFDGVDMDWEHPRRDGNSSKQYEELMVELAERLHAEGKQLSSAVLSGVTADGNIYYDSAAHTDKVLEAVDWINVMAYDGGDGERHSAYEFAVNCGDYWTNVRKMSASKVVLGVPFYARPSWAAYGDILAQVPDAWDKDHTDFNGMDAWYNGVATIEKKTAYALENLGGIMIWEVSQDASGKYSLQTAIGKMVKDSKN